MKRRPVIASKVQIGRFFRILLPSGAILIVGIVLSLGILVYKISNPGEVPEGDVHPSHYLLPSLEVSIPSARHPEIAGWWIPGRKNAPGILLATGYGMNRVDALSLAADLRQDGFNLLIYSQRGSGPSAKGSSALGLNEVNDMSDAIGFLQNQLESDRKRLGIWGVDVGAYAALKMAAQFPEVRAIVADNPFETVADFLNVRLAEDFGLDNWLAQFGCHQIFRLFHPKIFVANEAIPLQALSDRMILFIKGENRKRLESLTTAIYDQIQPHKEMISLKCSRIHSMRGEDLKSYDRQISNFFRLNLQ
jgi:pimeloyl-ACP methyl ester carboxylesterase